MTKFNIKDDDDIPLIKKDIYYDSDDDSNEEVFKKNDITLWVPDAVVLIVEHFQYYAVLLALSEHWGWPMSWVNVTCFTFIFNFDIWEFRKVETGLFDHSRVSFIDSEKLGFNYVSYLAAWAILFFVIGLIFGGAYVQWMRRRPLYLLLYIARWKRIMFMVLQFMAVPFGVVAARVFHCRKNDDMGERIMKETDKLIMMDVQNEFQCNDTVQLVLMILVIIIYAFLFLFYPFILSRWISEQVFSNDPLRHEGYIQLKEAEYEQGLDLQWDIGQYHLFSSFNRAWAYYNPLKFIFKLLFVLAFAFSLRAETVRSLFWSSAAITVLFCIATIALIIRRPFRVPCFNFMIIISHFVLSANSLIGNFMVRPPWEDKDKFQIVDFLLQPTITHILVAFNASWLILLLLWCIYLCLVNNGVFRHGRLWPRLSYESAIGDETKRYLKAALKARRILEVAIGAIPLFAPIHELSHQVQVINAYCREAEMIKDPTHDTLCDLLDELIEAHNTLAPISVFGLSGKNSIKETSEEFIKLMPSFKKRLKQREYDFILVSPLKRRMLLKMYVMSVFIGNIKKRSRPEEDVKAKLNEALALFDSRSLDNYDVGLSSVPSTSNSADRPATYDFGSVAGMETNMSAYLDNVDDFIGKNTNGRSSKKSSIDSFMESKRRTSQSKSKRPSSKKAQRQTSLVGLNKTNENLVIIILIFFI